ncbi:LysR family transcriptional regulator [Zobellella maritima]|uniref:LysR family transcriptional regulator n=1 Tax=Zobellella maritima TaxID=2059725 RepID=UPI000E30AE64|nr:LysR family transcriptional regulator [Zobellella maritima]
MDIKWLEDYLALCELRNFSRAAEARHITQPAFGRHIRALEAAVGQQLVDRSTSPLSLTPAGRQFRTLARNLTEQMTAGLDQLKQTPRISFEPVRVAAPHSLTTPTLLDLLELVEAPVCAIDILRVDFAVEALTEGVCDLLLAFDILSLMQPPFLNLCLGQGDFLLVGGTNEQGHPLFTPESGTIPYLRYRADSFSAKLVERQMPTPALSQLQPVFETSMCQLHKDMALRGKGVAWLPDCLIGDELSRGTLVPLNPDRLHIPYQIRLYRHQAPLSPTAERLWQTLTQRLAAAAVAPSPRRVMMPIRHSHIGFGISCRPS